MMEVRKEENHTYPQGTGRHWVLPSVRKEDNPMTHRSIHMSLASNKWALYQSHFIKRLSIKLYILYSMKNVVASYTDSQ